MTATSTPRSHFTRTAAATVCALLLAAVIPTTASAEEGTEVAFSLSGGDVHEFGNAVFHGSLSDIDLPTPVAAMAAHPSGDGYWLVSQDGAVHSFGNAPYHGDPSGVALAAPIIDIAPSASGNGYLLAASDGGVFTYGDATYHGSAGDIALAAPVVALTSTPSGDGYWLAAGDGGVFAYGDAAFHGSAGNITLAAPMVDILPTTSGDGYWMIGNDGGVFAFGAAPFHGSATAHVSDGVDLVGAALAADGDGYWLAASNGAVFSFGTAEYHGGVTASAGEPIADISATDSGYWLATTIGGDHFDTPIPANSGSGRRIVYSNSDQRIWVIEYGERIVATYLISGRRDTPSAGVYDVFSKSRYASAGHDGITMQYMVRFAHGRRLAIGFHSIPTYGNGRPMQSESALGTYRSSGCVRQRIDQAEFLFNWSVVGDTVIVLP